MLGAVPSGYDVAPHFQPVLADAQDAVATLKSQQRGRPTKQLARPKSGSRTCRTRSRNWWTAWPTKPGWLVFFYYRCEPPAS